MRLARPFGLLVALACLTAPGQPAAMASRMEFQSSGIIPGAGVTGSSALHFEGVDAGSLTTGSPFDLGRFGVDPGSNASYDFAPFDVTFRVGSVDGRTTPGPSTIGFRGWLDGTIRDGDASGVRVILAEMTPPEGSTLPPYLVAPFPTGDFSSVLVSAPGGPGVFDSGSIRLEAEVRPQALPSPAPEPGTIAVVGLGVALALGRSIRRARRRV